MFSPTFCFGSIGPFHFGHKILYFSQYIWEGIASGNIGTFIKMNKTNDDNSYISLRSDKKDYLDDQTKKVVTSFLDSHARQDMKLVEQKCNENRGKVTKEIWNARGQIKKIRTSEHSKVGGKQLSPNDKLKMENEFLITANDILHLKLYKAISMLEVEEDYSLGLESKIGTLEAKVQELEAKLQKRAGTNQRPTIVRGNSIPQNGQHEDLMVEYEVPLVEHYEDEGFIGDLASLISAGGSKRSVGGCKEK